MIRAARLLAAILPLAGLAGLWAQSDHTYRQGTEWEVPIQGYDPRDYLRGHYVEFSYEWNRLGTPLDFNEPIEALCISGQAPHMEGVTQLRPGETCAHPMRTDGSGVYGISALSSGRLYIGQDRADALQQQLQNNDQRGIVTIRQREDGSFTPISIRFRPLDPAEKAERDAQRRQIGTPFDPAAPPPVMVQ